MEDFVSAPWLRRLLTVVLLGGLVLLGFEVISPFIVPLLWAAILAYVSWPAYAWLLRWRGGRTDARPRSCMTVLVSAAVIVPLAWLAVVLRIELTRTYHDDPDAVRRQRPGAVARGAQAPLDRGPAEGSQRPHRAGPASTRSVSSCAGSPTAPSDRSPASSAT